MVPNMEVQNEPAPATGGVDVVALVRQLPWMAGHERRALEADLAAATYCEVAPGHVLMTQRTPAREAILVLGGTARVTVDGHIVGHQTRGEFVGDVGLLAHGTRSATVVAVTAMQLLVFSPRAFAVLSTHEVVARMARVRAGTGPVRG